MLTDAFEPDEAGYIRHWIQTRPYTKPYLGSETLEEKIRAEVIQEDPGAYPRRCPPSLGGPAPDGTTWHFHYPGQNTYVDLGTFHHTIRKVTLYASNLIVSNKVQEVPIRLWTANTIDLWQDQQHKSRYTRAKRKRVSASPTIVLTLKPGQNRLTVQLQELGVRDTPFLFALQLLDSSDGLKIAIPGHPAPTPRLAMAAHWLDTLTVTSASLEAPQPPPCPVSVTLDRPVQSKNRSWMTGDLQMSWHEEDIFSCQVELREADQRLSRLFEIPANLAMSNPGESLEAHQTRSLEEIATTLSDEPARSLFAVLARHALGTADNEADEAALQEGLDFVSGRLDCADFRLAALLRLYALDWGHVEQRNMIGMAAMMFRYWEDEDGNDAMAFNSENHSILFHGCQYIAGILFPEETFTASNRSGNEQRDLGRSRCLEWLNDRHAYGFTEYLSSTYSPLTAAALVNLIDFSDDKEIRTSATTLLDRLLRQLAEHTFDGVTTGPQGRVYRSVLYPHTSAAQGLLSFATGESVVESVDPWSVFVATLSTYTPPGDLSSVAERAISRTYHQANQCILLQKTPHYVISSVQIADDTPLKAGQPGYQEHLWHASLSRDCHIFANHPGTVSDTGISRPGYWNGNGILPSLVQRESTIFATYEIPPEHPVSFTHAHWPTDVFDESIEDEEGWVLGRQGNGFVGLWCSEATNLVSDVLVGRDLVAISRKVAWIARCADTEEISDLDAFRTSCLSLKPRYDPTRGDLFWDDRQIL
jgi:hypothetical protein